MTEDMTYQPVTDVTTLRQRVAELEAQQAKAIELLNYCVGFFAEIPFDNFPPRLHAMIHEYLNTVAPQPADDTDAPLILAAIDEDGDE